MIITATRKIKRIQLIVLALVTHYSLLATIEDLLGVGRLGKAAGARRMTDLVAP